MNIEKILTGIIQTVGRTIGVGHTTTLLRCVKDSDAPKTHIVFGDRRDGMCLEKEYQALTVTGLPDFESCAAFTGIRNPILFDNHAIVVLANSCLAKTEEYRREIAKKDTYIEYLEHEVSALIRRCGNAESELAVLKEKRKHYETEQK